MTMDNKGNIVSAEKAIDGLYYTSVKGNIVVKKIKKANNGRVILLSSETDNELDVKPTYLLREVDQQEVDMVTKKKAVKKGGKRAERKGGSFIIAFDKLKSAFAGGKALKVGDVSKKMKVEYRRVYMSLRQYTKSGLFKKVKAGTFQLASKK